MKPNSSDVRPALSDCLQQMDIDAYLLSDEPDAHPASRHARTCPKCREALTAAEDEAREFTRDVLPTTRARVVLNVLHQRRSARRSTIFVATAGLSLAAAACAVLLCRLPFAPVVDDATTPYIGAKGELGLEIHCLRDGQVHRVSEGERLAPGDALRFVPFGPDARPRHLFVIAIDERGVVSSYYPLGGTQSVLRAANGEPLPGSVILDDSEGLERLYLLAADAPLTLADIRPRVAAALAQTGSLEQLGRLPIAAWQVSLLIEKQRGGR
ncbi:MAG: hypothetical protein MUC50_17175 [Myxococcota bacterium]|jgi:hypothetical protein|nr:hypothetical protein [Myxococcota bacterium]